ncbi:orotate phosphoribosyltransferase [Ructibacterium gallinarum]|nr:orotate phosphoribosyltransferase [Ructibacterium gallinarum]
MMTKDEIIAMLKEAGVLLEGHFLLTSGRHSDKYMQCAKIFQDAKYSVPLCAELVEQYKNDAIDVVIGPAIGAISMSYEVGKQLGVRNIFAERENGVMTLRRGFTIEPGQRVLIVEDVVTTGGSVKEVMELVEKCGGKIVGIGSIVDRTGGKIDFGVPYRSAFSMDITSYEADKCPICKTGMPLVKPGSRAVK